MAFVFGDKVKIKPAGETGMVLRLNKGRQKTYCVVFACGRQENHHEDDLEPIPHPDTVLLDWASNPENGYSPQRVRGSQSS